MLLFVCWSGTRSRAAARALSQCLPNLVPQIKVFYSDQIEKGSLWFTEVSDQLSRADAGLICVTPENADSPWIHYEAGVLAAHFKPGGQRRIYTYLIGLDPRELSKGPLAAYQSTLATYDDTRHLLGSLVATLPDDPRPNYAEGSGAEQYRKWWSGFESDLARIEPAPLDSVVPRFGNLFARKTFDEPLTDCGNQRWLDRYDGARDTLRTVKEHVDRVRVVCPPYVADLYQQLASELDSYVGDLSDSLLSERRFARDAEGRIAIEPIGAVQSCERRRKRIKALVADISDPRRAPVFTEAVRFAGLETFEEKKNLIHRRTAELERLVANASPRRDSAKEADWRVAPYDRDSLDRAGNSDWDFDRIMAYVAKESTGTRSIDPARVAVERELEKYRASGDEASLMPLHYALGPLHKALTRDNLTDDARVTAHDLLRRIDEVTRARRRFGRINETIAEVRELLDRPRSAAQLAGDGEQTSGCGGVGTGPGITTTPARGYRRP